MRKSIYVLSLLLLLLLAIAGPAAAINFGDPDGDDHPYVGVMIFQVGEDLYQCSGFLVSPTVFVTAGHCTYGASAAWISFEEVPDYASFPAGDEWIPAASITPHPEYDDFASFPNTYDIGVVVLSEPVYLDQYAELPEEGFLDTLATARGTKDTTFTVVGYGVESFKPTFEWSGNRMQAQVQLINLRSYLTDGYNLMTTNNPGKGTGNGGNCSGDSGGPVLYSDTHIAVAVNSFGIVPHCKGNDYEYRLDIATSLNFVKSFLD